MTVGRLKAFSAKIFERVKIRSIKQRWLLYNLLIVTIIVAIGAAAFSAAITRYYYSGAAESLKSKARSATSFFESYITKTYAEYYDSAYKFIDTFEDSGVIELQFINVSGRVMLSSYSISGGTATNGGDIRSAMTTRMVSTWTGRNDKTGEKVLAVSAPMIYADGTLIGVMRYVTSLKMVDKEVMRYIGGSVAVGLLLILLVVITNTGFIRSVVEPIADITEVAQRISGGSYGIQISKAYRDEIGQMVNSINNMSLKIAQSEKAQAEFISSVSHELRTPLTAITGWSETIMYDESLDEDAKRGLEIINTEAKRLTNMVEELLEFTRIQDGRFTLNIQLMDVEAELEDAVLTYAELVRREGLTINFTEPEEELPLINGDPERLKQVFLNILDNASKYAKDGKKIDVSIGEGAGYINIYIRDYGKGVPEDELEYIKMKFYKGSSKERGSGIGLAVYDEIISYHNGVLEFRNAEGGGLLVTIRLPIPQ